MFALYYDRASKHALAGPENPFNAWIAARVPTKHAQGPQALIHADRQRVQTGGTGHVSDAGCTCMQCQPMYILLADLAPHSVSLESRGNSPWVCTGTCSITAMPAPGPVTDDLLLPYRDINRRDAYTTLWPLGLSTASPPAAQAYMR